MGEMLPQQAAAPRCFCCGPENPAGLKLRFIKESDTSVSTTFTPPDDWTGWGRIMHGGFQSLLLDETTSWAAFGALGERSFVTREITVRFLHPVRVGQPLTILGRVTEDRGRTVLVRGEIRSAVGELLTEAESVLWRLDEQAMRAVTGQHA
jgi:acyl-coenzyme A thioesterase PaaI-like protein